MEFKLLKSLDYDITMPNAYDFLCEFLKSAGHADSGQIELVSQMVLESTFFRVTLAKYRPSELAAASIAIARRACGLTTWNLQLANTTGYSTTSISTVASVILTEKAKISSKLTSLHEKWSRREFGNVADTTLAL